MPTRHKFDSGFGKFDSGYCLKKTSLTQVLASLTQVILCKSLIIKGNPEDNIRNMLLKNVIIGASPSVVAFFGIL